MDNRARILECALELFAARGYDAVGVQEIAEAAGITKPTLYHYYGSKHGLLVALQETYQVPFLEKVRHASAYQGDLPATLEKLTRAFFNFAQEYPVYYRMQLALYFAPRHSEAHQAVASVDEDLHGLVEAMFASASRDHGNMHGRQTLYAATFVGMLNTCIGLWLNGYLDLSEELIQRVVRQFQYGIYS